MLYYCVLSLALLGTASFSLVISLGTSLTLSFSLDYSANIFMVTLLNVSVCVLLWSYYYIDRNPLYRYFLSIVLSFLGSMFGLVLASDLLALLVFWDLLGFSSLFLVIFYRSRVSLAGGLLTASTNRVGDCFYLVFFGVLTYTGCSSSCVLFLLLVFVSLTKSAQVPFSSWLPAAISAPTPVSALVHSSTLVTAGVYLLYRFVPLPSSLLLSVGIMTSLVSGFAAVIESDVKKVVALSTARQLGVMVVSLGLNSRRLAFLHLNLHACVKALLFLGVGTAIHSVYGTQELRSLSNLRCGCPVVATSLLFSLFSLCGLPFLSGWVSKEGILFSFYSRSSSGWLLLGFYFRIMLTVAYSTRLVYLTFSVSSATSTIVANQSLSLLLKLPLMFLGLICVIEGLVLQLSLGLSLTCLRTIDCLSVLCCFLVGTLFGTRVFCLGRLRCPAFYYVRVSTSWLSSSISTFGTLGHTENSELYRGHACYLGASAKRVISSHSFACTSLVSLVSLYCLV